MKRSADSQPSNMRSKCRPYSAAMKAVDPAAQLSAVGYLWTDDDLEILLKSAAPAIGLLSVRSTDNVEVGKLQTWSRNTARPGILFASRPRNGATDFERTSGYHSNWTVACGRRKPAGATGSN